MSPLLSHAAATSFLSSPLLEKERERIVGQRSQRVVGTVEQEPCAARYRTEPADYQPVAVDGVVVQDVVLFELRRVVHEIVVDRVVPDLDHRVADDRVQVDRLPVVRAGIGLAIHGWSFQSAFTVMICFQSVVYSCERCWRFIFSGRTPVPPPRPCCGRRCGWSRPWRPSAGRAWHDPRGRTGRFAAPCATKCPKA